MLIVNNKNAIEQYVSRVLDGKEELQAVFDTHVINKVTVMSEDITYFYLEDGSILRSKLRNMNPSYIEWTIFETPAEKQLATE